MAHFEIISNYSCINHNSRRFSSRISFPIYFITVSNAKKSKKLKHGDEIIVRNPQAYIWIGFIVVVFAGIILSLCIIYPNGNGTWLVNHPQDIWIQCPISVVFIIMGLFIIRGCLLFELRFRKNENYFLYRSSYGITHDINYEDITYYKSTSGSFGLHVGKKFYSISNYAINLRSFVKMLKEKNVPSFEEWSFEHPRK